MQVIADLHLHSRFSRAVSGQMTIPFVTGWAMKKGLGLVASADWNHPMWMKEIQEHLEETGNGLYKLKTKYQPRLYPDQIGKNLDQMSKTKQIPNTKSQIQNMTPQNTNISPLFILTTEISCIYSQNGKGRRIHILLTVPSIKSALAVNQEMTKRGCNLLSDGRPIIGLSALDLTELVLTIEKDAIVIPAHIWTPWFSLYGSMSGFDSIGEAFGQYAKNIHAVETGLSSSPDMNWRIKELDNRAIISSSDSHSGPKMGREATVFEMNELSYENIKIALGGNKNLEASSIAQSNRGDKNSLDPLLAKHSALSLVPVQRDAVDTDSSKNKLGKRSSKFSSPLNKNNSQLIPQISYTIEFYPEEGKYHYTGHRACSIRLDPNDTQKKGEICPVCGKPLTQGVVQRVDELALRTESDMKLAVSPLNNIKPKVDQVFATKSVSFPQRAPFVMLVPLSEIIAESIGSPAISNKTAVIYDMYIKKYGSEFQVLIEESIEEIGTIDARVAEGVRKVRQRDIVIDPGYDGVFGVVKIWKTKEEKALVDRSKEQLSMF